MAEETKNAGRPAAKAAAQSRSAKRRRVEEEDKGYEGTALSMAGIRGLLTNSVMWKVVMGLLIFIFAVGFAITAVAPNRGQGGGGHTGGGPSRVAIVGNQTVSRDDYTQASRGSVEQMAQFGMKTSAMELIGRYKNSLEGLISDAAQYDDAVAKGMTPSDSEINAEIDKKVKEAVKLEGPSAAATRRQIEAQFGSMAEYEAKVREAQEKNRDKVAHQLAIDKLKKSIEDKNKTTEADYKRSVTKLDLYQITVRPKPEPVLPGKDAKASEEKSKADAKTRAEKLVETLKNADLATFKATAKKESDDFSTKEKGGSLGWMLPSQLSMFSPAVQEAVQNASGKIVGPLDDEYSGGAWQIFYVNGRKEELPKDYAKTKATVLKTYETSKDSDAWNKYVEELKKQKPAEILDPAMEAYRIQFDKVYSAQGDEQKKLRQEAIDKYQEALAYSVPDEAAAIHYQMAQLYQQDGKTDKYISTMQDALKDADEPAIRVQLAQALHSAKRDKEALEELKKASETLDKNPSTPSQFGNQDASVRMQIASAYEMMNKKDLAEKEKKKIPPAPPGGGGASPFSFGVPH